MTAATSQKLADVLRDAGFEQLAQRAEQDEFHDFLSPHALAQMYLADLLHQIYKRDPEERRKIAAMNIRQRLIDDEFEPTDEEADAWAKGPDGQEVFGKLGRRK